MPRRRAVVRRLVRAAQFESARRYVSVGLMSWQPRGRGAVAAPSVALQHDVVFQMTGGSRSTLESPAIEEETATDEELDLPWQVVVHNDPINLMSYVTMVFQKVLGFSRDKAEKHMLEVHQNGRSIVWSGVRERAELYVQQLHGYLLLATLERVR